MYTIPDYYKRRPKVISDYNSRRSSRIIPDYNSAFEFSYYAPNFSPP